MFRKIVSTTLLVALLLALSSAAYVGWQLYPHQQHQPLPSGLTALTDPAGQALLEGSEQRSDFERLRLSFQPQALGSFCGVASSVTVLNALGQDLDQYTFFTPQTETVRSLKDIMLGGMSLHELAGLLGVHGAQARLYYADQSSENAFRETIQRNLANDNDFLIVNYQRNALGQGQTGHISPLAAYDADTDQVLLMDVAEHKYPPTWIPVSLLFSAMLTTDASSGKMRGFVEVE